MSQSFWGSPDFEPKRAFRFLVDFTPNVDGGANLQFLAKSVSRPSYTVSSNPHKFFNHTFYYPGRVEWGNVTLTLVDAISPNASKIFMEYVKSIGYVDPTTDENAIDSTITKKTATHALGNVVIREMGTNENSSQAVTKGTWNLKNAFITEVNFGDHSYDNEELIDIQLTLQYDWATYE